MGLTMKTRSLVAQMIDHLPATQETWVRSLGQEDPLEEEMTTHSSILAWRIPWTEEPGGPQSIGSQRVGHDLATSLFRDCDASLPVSPATACQVIHAGLRPSGESAGCFTTET